MIPHGTGEASLVDTEHDDASNPHTSATVVVCNFANRRTAQVEWAVGKTEARRRKVPFDVAAKNYPSRSLGAAPSFVGYRVLQVLE